MRVQQGSRPAHPNVRRPRKAPRRRGPPKGRAGTKAWLPVRQLAQVRRTDLMTSCLRQVLGARLTLRHEYA